MKLALRNFIMNIKDMFKKKSAFNFKKQAQNSKEVWLCREYNL